MKTEKCPVKNKMFYIEISTQVQLIQEVAAHGNGDPFWHLFGQICKKKKLKIAWLSKNLNEFGRQRGLEKVAENCTMVRISNMGI